jgi:hypothetical protein
MAGNHFAKQQRENEHIGCRKKQENTQQKQGIASRHDLPIDQKILNDRR